MKPVKLRARWLGPPPRAGDFLMSSTRPRFAYRIREVHGDSTVRWDAAQSAEVRRLAITADRVDKTAVPPHARVHAWRWDRRAAGKRM